MQSINFWKGQFLNHCRLERRLSAHTTKAYRLDLGQLEQLLGPAYPVKKVDRDDLKTFLRSFETAKSRTIGRKVATLRSFFRYLCFQEVIKANPADMLVRQVRLEYRVPKTLSGEQVDRLFDGFYARKRRGNQTAQQRRCFIRDAAILEILFSTGVRVQELADLNAGDVQFERQALKVTGKGAKERWVPIFDGPARSALEEYWNVFRNKSEELEAPLFRNRLGGRISQQSVRAIVKQHSLEAGLEGITPHVLRHTIATLLLENGADIRYIQQLLGHSSIAVTAIYAKVNFQAQKRILADHHPRV